jgi:ferredoxin-type protein NapH
MTTEFRPGHEAIAEKGWLAAHKWLLLRRASQLFVIGLFLVGPSIGFWIVKGNLASSMTLDILPLTDPLILAQSFLAGHALQKTALIGAAIVIAFYMLVGGRVYCSWVCPVNIVTDAAHWFRWRMGLKGGVRFSRGTRYWVMAMTLVAAFATGTIVWELVNPVTMLFRGLVFGMGVAWVVVLAVFLFDLFVGNRAWCGHLCPVGAFYSLLGRTSLLRVKAGRREACDDCMDCFAVCPEPHVITPALRGADRGAGPIILAPNCTNCGRCIDVCAPNVFTFTTRFDDKVDSHARPQSTVLIREVALR